MERASTSRRAWTALGILIAGYLAIEAVAGAARSPLVPPLPAGASVPGWTERLSSWIGVSRLGEPALVAVSMAILVALVAAFGVLTWEAWKSRLAARAALMLTAVSLALAVAGPVLLSRDVSSYAAYGRMLSVHHANPYNEPPSSFPNDPFTRVVSSEWIDTRSVYGPAFTLASAGLTRAWSGSPSGTLLSFRVLAAVAIGLAALFAGRAARLVRPGNESLAVVLVGLNPVVVVDTVGGGHNDAIVAGLLAGGLLLALRAGPTRKPGGAGSSLGLALGATAVVTVAALVKVVAVIPLAFWLWHVAGREQGRERTRVTAWHVATIALVTVALTAPVFAGWRTITALANLASRQGWASGARLVARGAEAIGRSIGGSNTGSAFGLVVYAGFLFAFVLLARALGARRTPSTGDGVSPDGPAGRQASLWGSGLLLFALAAPYLLPWYAAWFLPFLALVPDAAMVTTGIAVGAMLAITGVPAEPAADPSLWRAMVLGVHYGIAPVVLVLFFVAAGRVRLLAAPNATCRPSLRSTTEPIPPAHLP